MRRGPARPAARAIDKKLKAKAAGAEAPALGSTVMAPPRITFDPLEIAEAKRLYEQTLTPVQVIAAKLKISRDTLAKRINEWGWDKRCRVRRANDVASEVRAVAVADIAPMPPEQAAARRVVLAERILGVVEHKLEAVDRVLQKLGPADAAEAERSARTLASLSSALHEIAALVKPGKPTPPDETDDDTVPLDIDELREELARRLHALIDARAATTAGADIERICGPDDAAGGG